MENEGSNIFLLILFGSLLTLLMAGFIVTMVLIHRSRQIKNKQKLESLKAEFEKTILNVEKEIQEEKPFILSKNNLIKEESVILEKKTTIKELAEETITESAIVKKINKKLNNNVFKLISDDYYYNKDPSTLEISHLTKIIKKTQLKFKAKKKSYLI